MNAKEKEFIHLAIYHLRNATRELEDALGDPRPDPLPTLLQKTRTPLRSYRETPERYLILR